MLKEIEGNKRFKKRLPSKKRFRFFLFFVFISFSFWLSTKLSNSYTVEQTFNIEWINIPEGVIIPDNDQKLNTSITASGVEIILYRLFSRAVTFEINLFCPFLKLSLVA